MIRLDKSTLIIHDYLLSIITFRVISLSISTDFMTVEVLHVHENSNYDFSKHWTKFIFFINFAFVSFDCSEWTIYASLIWY